MSHSQDFYDEVYEAGEIHRLRAEVERLKKERDAAVLGYYSCLPLRFSSAERATVVAENAGISLSDVRRAAGLGPEDNPS